MNKFQLGQKLSCGSACDYESKFSGTVSGLSKCFVTIDMDNNFGSVKVKRYFGIDGNEICWPLGKFSMAPIFEAKRGAE